MAKARKKPRSSGAAVKAADVPGARDKIIKIATKLFSEKGLDGVTVREIAKATKSNVSLVSYYFGGKEGLYRTILQEHALKTGQLLKEAVLHSRRTEVTREVFREDVHMVVRQLVEMRLQNDEISVLMQRERLSGLPHSRKIYEETMAPIAEDLIGLVTDAQKQGIVRKNLNARSYFIALIESIFGYFAFHDCGLKIWKDAYRFPKDKDDYIEFLVCLFTEGIFA